MNNIKEKVLTFYNQKRKEFYIITGLVVVLIIGSVLAFVFLGNPSPPEEVLATTISYEEVRLTWIDYQRSTDGYIIYRSDMPGEGYEEVARTSSQHYLDPKLEPGTLYYYRVASVKGDKESEPSREAHAITESVGIVTGLKESNIAYNELEIVWNDFRGSEGYTIYRTESLDRPYVRIDTTTENTYTDTDLDSGRVYYYVVTQTVDGEESDYSSQLTVATREWICGNQLEYDGQTYSTVKIGDQCWFAENLNYETTQGSWCYNNEEKNCDLHGRLYNFTTVTKGEKGEGVQGICPDRWHIPTDEDFKVMEREIGMGRVDSHSTGWRGLEENIGDKLKRERACSQERSAFCGETGVDVSMGGSRSTAGAFRYIGTHTFLWTSTVSGDMVWRRLFSAENSGVHREASDRENGFSVRCIRNGN